MEHHLPVQFPNYYPRNDQKRGKRLFFDISHQVFQDFQVMHKNIRVNYKAYYATLRR